MLNEHDQALLLRCRRLGHEVTFGYCRQETGGKPCRLILRLILDCWWEQFNVRAFLQAHLSAEEMSAVERAGLSAPTSKVQNLFDLIQQTKDRLKEKP